jgi:hypothetical protein
MQRFLKKLGKKLIDTYYNLYFCPYPCNTKQLKSMKDVAKKRYIKPVLLKHGMLRKLTLKTGSVSDGISPGMEI